jgi:hypothetical protein
MSGGVQAVLMPILARRPSGQFKARRQMNHGVKIPLRQPGIADAQPTSATPGVTNYGDCKMNR